MHINPKKSDAMIKAFVSDRPKLIAWVKRFLHNRADVEDVVQEAFIRSYQQLMEQEVDNPRAYLYTAARNLAFKQNDLAVNRLGDALEILDLQENIELEDPVLQMTEAKEEMSWLCESIRQLPLQCRKVFVLKKIYGFSHREISERLGLSENTVHQHLAKGVARCTLYMAEHGFSRGDTQKMVAGLSKKENEKI